MAREFKLSLLLSARDEASKSITRSLRETVKETQKAEQAQEKLNRRQKTTAQDAISQGRARTEDMKRQSRAYETLGIRSERAIQREISQTIAAYNRLARSGMMSADEQARAFDRMRQRVGQLRGEMKQMSNMKIGNIANGFVTAAGGLYAGARVVAEPVKRQMSYEERLARMSNTAYSDLDDAGRLAGQKKLDELIRKSVSDGGGSIDNAAEVLNKLLSEGIFTDQEISGLLPLLQKYATASGVDGLDLASVTSALKKNFNLSKPDDIKIALDMALKGGQEGAFELPDMAKWLAQQLSAANAAGMSGLDDFASIVAANQAVVSTAGTNDQAGNNLMNFLLKLNSRELSTAASRIKVDGYGIDLSGTLINAREKGIDPIDAFVGLTDKISANNPKYKALQTKLDNMDKNDPERAQTLSAMTKIAEGSALGELIADQGTLMALIGLRSQSEYKNQVKQKVLEQKNKAAGEGEGDIQFRVMSDTNAFKANQAGNTHQFAEYDSTKPLSDAVGSLAEQFTAFSAEFPGLTTALTGAKTGIEAMTQAAVAFAALKFLFGGAGAGSTGGIAGTVGTSGATAASGGWLKPGAFKLAGLATVATEFATANTPEETDELINGEARMAALRARYGDNMIAKAKERFQPWYQFGSGYAAENEEWVSQYIREQDEQAQLANAALSQVRFMSEHAGMKADALPKEFVPDYARPVSDDVIAGLMLPVREIETLLKNQQTAPQPIEVRSVVELDGHVIAETVNNINGNDAGRTTGGGL
ncbi:phage tail tape measure protein [Morganella morganii]|uniref:phage tail tape measure protein n=1 Tax=Morganella morganii TaxID=582 RepID=UPI001C45E3DA|nr:phage tail tape measure protein [Morganella morganii]QXO58469.1 phage tail tape measure protein [Morganella morganii]QXO60772.1 phage tail tape measure protein [Morganella morganii]QXO77433.1 phage tail tape measure protein [Morganella morganii]